LDPPPREVIGVEAQAKHLEAARTVASAAPGSVRVELLGGDLFGLDLRAALDWRGGGPLLVVGNPPWVTSAELGVLGSRNGPERGGASPCSPGSTRGSRPGRWGSSAAGSWPTSTRTRRSRGGTGPVRSSGGRASNTTPRR